MARLRQQSGFTLIEVVVVMAIASLMVAGVLAGQGLLRDRTAFTGAIDQIKNQLIGVRNEATHPIIEPHADASRPAGLGNSDWTVYGKVVEFDNTLTPASALAPSRERMAVSTLVQDETAPEKGLVRCDTKVIPFKEGTVYNGSPNPGLTTIKGDRQAIIYTSESKKIFLAPDNYIATSTMPSCSTAVSTYVPPATVPAPCAATGTCPPPPPPACNETGYICGLLASYYKQSNYSSSPYFNPFFINIAMSNGTDVYTYLNPTKRPVTLIDGTIGSSLNSTPNNLPSGASSWSNINNTLFARLMQPPSAQPPPPAFVQWQGQINIDHAIGDRVCIDANAYSYLNIAGQAAGFFMATNASGNVEQRACVNSAALPNGWTNVAVSFKFDPSPAAGVNSAKIRLVTINTPTNTVTEVPQTDLRTNESVYNARRLLPPAAPQITHPDTSRRHYMNGSDVKVSVGNIVVGDTIDLYVDGIKRGEQVATGTTMVFDVPAGTTATVEQDILVKARNDLGTSPDSNVLQVKFNTSFVECTLRLVLLQPPCEDPSVALLHQSEFPNGMQGVMARLNGLVGGSSAHAAPSPDQNILNPNNLQVGVDDFTADGELLFQRQDLPTYARIIVRPGANTITRSFDQ
jgi:prepilin-type N-terminal cleavage/methylation domain-containing protein